MLLTKDHDLTSKVIRYTSKGNFSHATFVIKGEQTFEADEDGVGITTYRSHPIKIKGVWTWCILFPYDRKDFVVYRHPDLNKKPIEESKEVIDRITREHYGDPYSKLTRLEGASELPPMMRPLARMILSYRDNRAGELSDGLFCSELVAIFFQELGLRLFDKDRPASTVNPSALTKSRLVPAPTVETRFNPSLYPEFNAIRSQDDILKASYLQPRSTDLILEILIKAKEETQRLAQATKISSEKRELLCRLPKTD